MNEKKYIINGKEYNVAINSYTGSYAEVTVNGTVYQVKIEDASSAAQPAPSARPYEAPVVEVQPQTVPAPVPSGNARPVNAPLPGVVIGIKVKAGDAVKEGQVVAILEAMKMENEILAPADATVKAVHVAAGQAVQQGDALIELA